jgi:hypothetical protein
LDSKTKETQQIVVAESKKNKKSSKQMLLESVNEQIKRIQVDGKLNKQDKKELIKKLLSSDL